MKNNEVATRPSADTFGHPEVKHPYSPYSLSDAVKLARGIASIREETVSSLVEARTLIQRSAENSGHNWITGAVALDVLDAAIDGRDLLEDNRIIHAEPDNEKQGKKSSVRPR